LKPLLFENLQQNRNFIVIIYYSKYEIMNELKKNMDMTFVYMTREEFQEIIDTTIAKTLEKFEKLIVEERSDRLLTTNEVSKQFNVDASTLWRWEKRNYLLPVRLGGKKFYKLSDLKKQFQYPE